MSSYLVDLVVMEGVGVSVESSSRSGDVGGLIVLRSESISWSSEVSCVLRSVRMTSFFNSVRDVFAVMPMCWKRIG